MAKTKSPLEVKCHPEAPEKLHKWVANYNWLARNYSKVAEQFGRSYVAVHNRRVVASDEKLSVLQEKLGLKFPPEEYETICIAGL